ncbi:MAG: LamG-like jellyroll fold domain-containing protein, partial [bacterium]|nr:LamG-like jellyroll fold domain-containing protein [bacterium]
AVNAEVLQLPPQLKWNNEQLSLFTNLTAATIEFFYKSDADAGVSSYANVIGFQGSRKDHPGEGGGVMSIQIANPSNSFRFAMNTTTAGNCVCAAPESYYKDHSPSCDGAWHHVAGVVSNEVDKVRMRLFIDYEERRTITFNGNIRRDLESMSLLVGGGFNGLLDEVRITAKALPVEKFLRRASAPGLTILFR